MDHAPPELKFIAQEFSLIVFVFKIIICFNLGFYDKVEMTLDRFKIVKKYLAFGFWVDIICVIALIQERYFNAHLSGLNIIFFIRIIDINFIKS
jgi:hypothetical protein